MALPGANSWVGGISEGNTSEGKMTVFPLRRRPPKWTFLFLLCSLTSCGGGASPSPASEGCDPSTAPEVLAVEIKNTDAAMVQDYPTAVQISGANFDFNLAGTTGSKIGVWDSTSKQPLAHWIESYDAGVSKGVIWAKVGSLPAQGSITIWVTGGDIPKCAGQSSSGSAVFPFFSDVQDAKNWTATNQLSVSDQITASPLQITNKQVITSDGTYNGSNSVAEAANGDWVLAYRKGTTHINAPLVVLRRSQDKGTTWDPEIVYFGMPGSDPSLFNTPGGDLMLSSEKSNAMGTTGAVYTRSTDSGISWSPFTFFDNPVNAASSFPTRFLNDGTTIYGASYTADASVGSRSTLWMSTDDGLTWSKRSEIRQSSEPGINETAIAKIGDDSILAMSRTDSAMDTLAHFSHDLGLTWDPFLSYYSEVGVLQLPQLIQSGSALILFGREAIGVPGIPASTIFYPLQLVAFVSYDNGKTFGNGTVLDDYTGLSIDGGYCWPMLMADGRVFVSYYADSQNKDLPDIKSLILDVGTPQTTTSSSIHVVSQFAPGVATRDLNISSTRYAVDFRFQSHEIPGAGQFSVGLSGMSAGQPVQLVEWELPSTHAVNPRTNSGFIAQGKLVVVTDPFLYDHSYRLRSIVDETQGTQLGQRLDLFGNVVSALKAQPLAQGMAAHAATVSIGNNSSLRTTDTLLDFVFARPVASVEPEITVSRLH